MSTSMIPVQLPLSGVRILVVDEDVDALDLMAFVLTQMGALVQVALGSRKSHGPHMTRGGAQARRLQPMLYGE